MRHVKSLDVPFVCVGDRCFSLILFVLRTLLMSDKYVCLNIYTCIRAYMHTYIHMYIHT
jgi:hypothetical protein